MYPFIVLDCRASIVGADDGYCGFPFLEQHTHYTSLKIYMFYNIILFVPISTLMMEMH